VGDFAVRLEIWSRATQVIGDFPLTGTGLGSFRVAVPALYPYVMSDPEKVHHAHNVFLQIGSDLGLFGLIAFLGLLAALLSSGVRALNASKKSNDPLRVWLVIGCMGGLVALLTHGLVDCVTWGTRAAPAGWAVLGLLAALTTESTWTTYPFSLQTKK
jgi:putative inorganic carbon (HCO3(-)) transporter